MNAVDPVDDRTRIIALALTRSIGWKLIHGLLEHFGSLEAVLSADAKQLCAVRGIGPQIAASILGIDLPTLAEKLFGFEASGITYATWQDTNYPSHLQALDDKPLVVFWKGHILPVHDQTVAIVGAREAQPESLRLAFDYAAAFAQRGWTVVSGLARGIDSAAHRGALSVGGRSLAALGCGVNVIYPPENSQLSAQLVTNGAILSELHPDTPPSPNALMRRNRLITALSSATIVVEAGHQSGALYAARCARDQGRIVFALDNSEGNHALLNDFAELLPPDVDAVIERVEADQQASR